MLRATMMTLMMTVISACGPSATVTNVVALQVAPPTCVASEPRAEPWLIDIDADVDADASVLPLVIQSDLVVDHGDGPYIYLANEAALFFTTDGGALSAFPADATSARRTSAASSVFNTQTQTSANPLFALTALTGADLVALRNEPAVIEALTSTEARLRLDLHLQVSGNAAPLVADDDTVLPVASAFSTIAVDLCDGCLTSSCVATANSGACFIGLDHPSTTCSE